MLIFPKMILWWHFSNIEGSAPYIKVISKYKIDAIKWIVYSMSRLVDNLFISCWWRESIKCTTICIGNIIIALFWVSSIKISNKNRASRKFILYVIHKSIQVCINIFKLVSILTRWSVEISKEALFNFQTNFSYQTVTYKTEIVSHNKRNMFLIVDRYASFFRPLGLSNLIKL